MNTQSKKAKGRRLQQYVVELILKAFPMLTSKDVRSVPASVTGSDIWLSERAAELFPFSVECKNQERINLYQFWEQTKKNAVKEERLPLLVVKKNRKEALAVLELETLFALIKAINSVEGSEDEEVGGIN